MRHDVRGISYLCGGLVGRSLKQRSKNEAKVSAKINLEVTSIKKRNE